MKILVTGSYGQLGRSLFNHLNSNIEIFWTGRNIPFDGNGFYLDICDRINLKELINLITSKEHKNPQEEIYFLA